jgi:cob(I)alamin adenosyltransferase
LEETDIVFLEEEIDKMDEVLPLMKNFILPGGNKSVSALHIARCICRRAERCCVRLQMEDALKDSIIIKYLNRLSDYLFVLARFTGYQLQVKEIPWKP